MRCDWRLLIRAFAAGLAGFALAACGGPGRPVGDAPVRVFAASSLTDVMQTVGEAWVAEGHAAPVFNFAASSDLARQIEQGADADVFISADEAWMDYLAKRDLIAPETRRTLLGNELVLIAPADRAFVLELAPGADLVAALNGGTLAIANPDSVPAGRYAREALEWMGAWEAVAGKAARAESVRAALRFVETGEAAAGIVYRTDAIAAADRVIIVGTFPDGSHTPVSYPAAATANAKTGARAMLEFLSSERANAILSAAGFEPAPQAMR